MHAMHAWMQVEKYQQSSSQAWVDRDTVTDGQEAYSYRLQGHRARTMCVRDQEAERRPTLLNTKKPE